LNFTGATTTLITLTVKANNSCGSSPIQSRTINVNLNCKVGSDFSEEIAVEENVAVNLYPNPSNGRITLSFTTTSESSYLTSIFDMAGRLVYSDKSVAIVGENTHEIILAGVPAGMYMVRVSGLGKEDQVLRLIVE
jgi:hypothetical protein